MGKFSRLGNDLYTGRRVDRLRRPQVALVLHLRPDRRARRAAACTSRASTWASSSRRRAVPRHAVRRPGDPGQRRQAPRGRRRHRHHAAPRLRSSPPPARPASSCRPSSSATPTAQRGRRHHPDDGRRARRRHVPGRDRGELGQGGRQTVADRPRRVPGPRRALHLGATSASGRCRWPRIVALAHDVVITVGIYALSGFEVTPATVTGLLTILGFSLYDTVVVFDKVRENTKNLRATRKTYAEAANLAVNQTLVRSINTSIVALIPVGAHPLRRCGAARLGSLKDLALALFVGMAAGAYSSIFIATPLLVQLKAREPANRAIEKRLASPPPPRGRPLRPVPAFAEDMPVRDEHPTTTATTGDDERRRAPGGRHVDRARAGPRPAAAVASYPRRGGRSNRAAPRDAPSRAARRGPSGARSDRRATTARATRSSTSRTSRARGRLQGHHPGARRPRGLHRGGRGAGRGRAATTTARRSSTTSWAWRRAGSSSPPPSRWRSGPASSRCARPASCRERRTRESYALEYGEATLEMHRDALAPGSTGAARRRRAGDRRHRRGDRAAGRAGGRHGVRRLRADGPQLPAGPRGRSATCPLTSLLTV